MLVMGGINHLKLGFEVLSMSSSEKDIFFPYITLFPLHAPLNISLYLGFTKIQGVYLLHPNALKKILKKS